MFAKLCFKLSTPNFRNNTLWQNFITAQFHQTIVNKYVARVKSRESLRFLQLDVNLWKIKILQILQKSIILYVESRGKTIKLTPLCFLSYCPCHVVLESRLCDSTYGAK